MRYRAFFPLPAADRDEEREEEDEEREEEFDERELVELEEELLLDEVLVVRPTLPGRPVPA